MAGSWQKNRGLRIDHILTSNLLIEYIEYLPPDDLIGKDGSPAISERFIGNYKKFKIWKKN